MGCETPWLPWGVNIWRLNIIKKDILCECGLFVDNHSFKDYIQTSIGPSTPTIGHNECGLIFDFIDGSLPKRYSSRKELKKIAVGFSRRNKMDEDLLGRFLLEVDRLKSLGTLSDQEILIKAWKGMDKSQGAETRWAFLPPR